MEKLLADFRAALGITAFSIENGKMVLTEEQKTTLLGKFAKESVEKVELALASVSLDQTQIEQINSLNQLVAQTRLQLDELNTKLEAEKNDKTSLENTKNDLEAKITTLEGKINTLSNSREDDPPPLDTKPNTSKNDVMNDKYLFGEKSEMFAIGADRPYNMRAFAALAARTGQMITVPKASTVDYARLETDLGEWHRIRNMNNIQTFFPQLATIESEFPLVSGVKNGDALVNLFMSEFSQADNSITSDFDNVVKGSVSFEAEIIVLYKVMIAHKFRDLKALEDQWIRDLNKEGSSPIKMSFIMFIVSNMMKIIYNEREQRRIRGIRKNPSVNVPGKSMEAANGWLKVLKNYIAQFKVQPFVVGEWTESTISHYIQTCTAMIPEAWRSTGRVICYLSKDALTAYHKNNEALFGLNQDYKPDMMTVKNYEDVRIRALANMGNSKRIMWTLEGNWNTLEETANEMYQFYFERRNWTLEVSSHWTEGIQASLVGKKFTTAAEFPGDYSTQLIWCNDVDEPASYFIEMTADDTSPSVINHTSLKSVANTVATAITDFDDAAVGQEVIIKYGNSTHGITIDNSGKFSLLASAWTGQTVGDTIKLKKRSDGKWIELERTSATSDAIVFDADDTSPSLTGGTEFITNANLHATAITTFDNAIENVVYKINGAGTTYASTIANSGNFVLTAAMTLSAGTWIKLQKAGTKFYEILRG